MSRTKIPKEDIFAKMQDLGYTILDEFKNTKCSVNFRCKRGHTWKIQVANVYREMSGCPECARPSSEASSIFIMENLLGKRFKKTRRVLPSGLELDGYNQELMLAIEYNGSQHYIENRAYYHREDGSFEAQLNRDKLKREECIELGINLITVHYKLNTFNKIQEYIQSELIRLGYEINDNLDWEELKTGFRRDYDPILDAFKSIKELVEEKNGVCLSTNYVDRLDPMLFKCEVAEHPVFEKTPADIRRNVWCNECAHNAPQSTDSINEEFKPYGIFLVNEYVPGSHTIQTFSCDEGHIIERQLDNMRRTIKIGKGCITCNNVARRVPVYQYTSNGTYVATFAAISDIPNLSNSVNDAVFRNAVRLCMIDESKIAYDFVWSFLSPIHNKLVRYRNSRDEYNREELEFIDKYELQITSPTKVIGTSTTGATKRKNLAVLKFDLNLNQVIERFDSVTQAIGAGNKKSTVYNSCAKFGKNKKIANTSKCKVKQVFIYEDDNQIIPWVSQE